VEELLHRLTLKEKVALLSGQDSWNSAPVPRLGVPSLTMTDGPHGVRTQPDPGRKVGPATSFPCGVSMAASWNPGLIERVAEALAEETLAMGCDILLGPCVNIVRHPLAGRNFEAFSEDPFLAGQIGTAWVKGVQRRGVGASLKHFACNNQETDRGRGSSEIDERSLREIYLAQFEMVVKQADPWTVMCSYNRINGVYASQNHHLLNEILKQEWGYPGVVVSDWGANHTTVESVAGGMDLEMPGPAKYYGRLLVEAVENWQIDESAVDEAARRVLRMALRSGRAETARPAGAVNTRAHQDLARELAEESITLLKNEGSLLPVDLTRTHTIAVIGPQAEEGAIGGGGSSFVEPPYRTSLIEGLRNRLSGQVKIEFEQGCDNTVELPVLRASCVTAPALGSTDGAGRQPGLLAEYFRNNRFEGEPVERHIDRRLDLFWSNLAPFTGLPELYSVRWSGELRVPASGRYTLAYHCSGIGRLILDGKTLAELKAGEDPASGFYAAGLEQVALELEARKGYDLQVEYARLPGDPYTRVKLMFGAAPEPGKDERFERAVELARRADLVIFNAGLPEGFESEGYDRAHMDLPGRQNELIRAVAEANPKTVVVIHAGSPVTMPWLDGVPAVVEAYYPGMEGGNALARVLVGDVNPSGKLTVTFPQRLEDTPAYTNFHAGRKVLYGEGIFVGYRGYDARGVEPLFPFGHGLSYTRFEMGSLRAVQRARAGENVRVSVEVRNVGERAGKEVVQVYVADPQSSLPRPPKELKDFQKVKLEPGETRTLEFELDARAFAFYDPLRKDWVVEPGEFEVLVGSSARDIRVKTAVILD